MKYKQKTSYFPPDEVGEYLEANGYSFSEGKLVDNALYFLKDGKGVVIYGDNVDFMKNDDENHFVRYMSISGIGTLNIDKWKLLFQITDIIP